MAEPTSDPDAPVLSYAGGSPTRESYRPASGVRRTEAAATSAVPIVVWGLLLNCAGFSGCTDAILSGLTPGSKPLAEGILFSIGYGLPFVCNALYAASYGATYGMRNRKVVYRSTDGRPISGAHRFVRALVGVALLWLLPVSIVVAIIDKRKRSLADLVCGTTVWMMVRA